MNHQSLVRKGVGSNPTLINIHFCLFVRHVCPADKQNSGGKAHVAEAGDSVVKREGKSTSKRLRQKGRWVCLVIPDPFKPFTLVRSDEASNLFLVV